MFWDGSVEPLPPPYPKLRVRRSFLYRTTSFLAPADDTREARGTRDARAATHMGLHSAAPHSATGYSAMMGGTAGAGPGDAGGAGGEEEGLAALVPHSGHGYLTLEVATGHGLNPDGSSHLPNTNSNNEEVALAGWCCGWACIRLKLNGTQDVAVAMAEGQVSRHPEVNI